MDELLTPIIKTQQARLEFANPNHDPDNGRFAEAAAGKVAKELIKDVRQPNSGATLEPTTGQSVKSGWAVGGVLPTVSVDVSSLGTRSGKTKAKEAVRKQLIAWAKSGVFDHPEMKVGAWNDGKGHVVIEPSENVADGGKARNLGRLRNQEAVANLGAIATGDFSDSTFPSTGGNGIYLPLHSPLIKVKGRYTRKNGSH